MNKSKVLKEAWKAQATFDNQKETDPVYIYAIGLINLSCCADGTLTSKQVEEFVQTHSPSGTMNNWQLDEEGSFRQGGKNGIACDKFPDRKHWLLVC
jgi:hypothetical protein